MPPKSFKQYPGGTRSRFVPTPQYSDTTLSVMFTPGPQYQFSRSHRSGVFTKFPPGSCFRIQINGVRAAKWRFGALCLMSFCSLWFRGVRMAGAAVSTLETWGATGRRLLSTSTTLSSPMTFNSVRLCSQTPTSPQLTTPNGLKINKALSAHFKWDCCEV